MLLISHMALRIHRKMKILLQTHPYYPILCPSSLHKRKWSRQIWKTHRFAFFKILHEPLKKPLGMGIIAPYGNNQPVLWDVVHSRGFVRSAHDSTLPSTGLISERCQCWNQKDKYVRHVLGCIGSYQSTLTVDSLFPILFLMQPRQLLCSKSKGTCHNFWSLLHPHHIDHVAPSTL